jgi:hypothetical protein
VSDFVGRVLDSFDVRGISLSFFALVAKHLYQRMSGLTNHGGHLPQRSKIIFLDGHYSDTKESQAKPPLRDGQLIS